MTEALAVWFITLRVDSLSPFIIELAPVPSDKAVLVIVWSVSVTIVHKDSAPTVPNNVRESALSQVARFPPIAQVLPDSDVVYAVLTVTIFVVLLTLVILLNCRPELVFTHSTALPSVATPDKSGLSADKSTDVLEAVTPPVPVSAVNGPAPLAAVSEPVEELNVTTGSATGYTSRGNCCICVLLAAGIIPPHIREAQD